MPDRPLIDPAIAADLDAVFAAAHMALTAKAATRAAASRLVSEHFGPGYGLVLTDFGVIAMHIAAPGPRCIAITGRGARCRNPVFDGQVWHHGDLLAHFTSPADGLRLQTQRCALHAERITTQMPSRWSGGSSTSTPPAGLPSRADDTLHRAARTSCAPPSSSSA
jgi:hypothetical protein